VVADLSSILVLAGGLGGGIAVYAAAAALGFRHGIDWDHIAAITDITSASASIDETNEAWLMGEPGFNLTDESHHQQHPPHDGHVHPEEAHHVHEHADDGHAHGEGDQVERHEIEPVVGGPAGGVGVLTRAATIRSPAFVQSLPPAQRTALWHGTLYALGHGTIVTILGVLAIVAAEVLPDWVDGVMERVVGVTLIFLAAYLFFSLYQYFRAGGEFRIRSRWMLVFAGVANAWGWVRSRLGHHHHVHTQPQNYTGRTAYAIGVVHGIGAETGTQALIIATAVGATSKTVAIGALLFFVAGLLVSNSFVTFASTTGFVSARKRRIVYIGAGMVAAIFSLVVGLVFLNATAGVLPDLDKYVHWVGGPTH
jgi:cytochrome c biogenesis protein CcdA